MTESKTVDELKRRLSEAEKEAARYKYDFRQLELRYGAIVMREGRLLDYIRDNGLKPPK